MFGSCGPLAYLKLLVHQLPVTTPIQSQFLKLTFFQTFLKVMLYKKLFDDLIAGITTKETVTRHIQLDLQRKLGAEVLSHCKSQGISGETLDSLFDTLSDRYRNSCQILIIVSAPPRGNFAWMGGN